MSSTRIVPDDAKDQFWSVVRDCLHEFHKMTAEITRRKAAQLRKKIESMPNETMEFFYHSEPFDVACDIANQPVDLLYRVPDYAEPLPQSLTRPSCNIRKKLR
jgi:hypothetical protein